MATIKIISATAETTANARSAKFELSSYFLPEGVNLTIAEAAIVSHSIDGESKNNGCPVLWLYRGTDTPENRVPLYLRSALKRRTDYKDNIINVVGTLNDLIKSFAGKTVGELIDHLNTLKGKAVTTTVTEYRGVNKNGDVQTISVNGYNII